MAGRTAHGFRGTRLVRELLPGRDRALHHRRVGVEADAVVGGAVGGVGGAAGAPLKLDSGCSPFYGRRDHGDFMHSTVHLRLAQAVMPIPAAMCFKQTAQSIGSWAVLSSFPRPVECWGGSSRVGVSPPRRNDAATFWTIWNRPNYEAVKCFTYPHNVFHDLYDKTCRAARGLDRVAAA